MYFSKINNADKVFLIILFHTFFWWYYSDIVPLTFLYKNKEECYGAVYLYSAGSI